MRRFVANLEDDGLGASSIRCHVAALKVLFATAYEDGLIPSNPTAGLRLHTTREDKPPAKALTTEELRLVLTAMPDEWRPFFAFLSQTGLRIGEAIGLSWSDVDLGSKPHVKVRQQWRDGKLAPLKTANSRREIPLSKGSVSALLARRATDYTGEDGPVWSNTVGGRLSSHNLRKRVLKPTTEPLGLGWVGFHTFRHTCASLMFASPDAGGGGKNVKQVQTILGHADPGFTMSTYVHLMGDGVGSMDFLDLASEPFPSGNRVVTNGAQMGATPGVPTEPFV